MRATKSAVLFCIAVSSAGCTEPAIRAIRVGPPSATGYVGELWHVTPHHEGVKAVRFSDDARRIVTGGGDGFARVWDAHTGALLAECGPHGNFWWQHRVLTLVLLCWVPPWDPMGCYSIPARSLLRDGTVRDVDLTPDGRHVVTGSSDGTCRLWSADSGRLERILLRGNVAITAVDVAESGEQLVAAAGNRLHVIGLRDGTLRQTVKLDLDGVHSAAWAGDRRVATKHAGGELDGPRIWNLTSGDAEAKFADLHTRLSPDLRWVATYAPRRKTLLIHDRDGKLTCEVHDMSPPVHFRLKNNGLWVKRRKSLVFVTLPEGVESKRLEVGRGWLIVSSDDKLVALMGYGMDARLRVYRTPD